MPGDQKADETEWTVLPCPEKKLKAYLTLAPLGVYGFGLVFCCHEYQLGAKAHINYG